MLKLCAFVVVWLAGNAHAEVNGRPGAPASRPLLAAGMDLDPDQATQQRVVAEGVEVARLADGYSARNYVLYEVPDARGQDLSDVTFLERFSDATLTVGDRTLGNSKLDRSQPSIGVYPLAKNRRERTVGTLTYWFVVDSIPAIQRAAATLSFSDDQGHPYRIPIDFSTRP